MNSDILDQGIDDGRGDRDQNNRTVILWAFVLFAGFLFKIMHWPFATLLLLLGSAGLHAFGFSGYLFQRLRSPLNTTLCMLGFIWMAVMIWGAFANNGHPFNLRGLLLYTGIFLVITLVFLLIYSGRLRSRQSGQA